MADDLLSGKLINVMPDFKPVPTELWLVFPSRQLITPAARVLRDRIKEECSAVLAQLIEKGILDKSVLD
jgi:DNA-binding transcriptional LysR family regulator